MGFIKVFLKLNIYSPTQRSVLLMKLSSNESCCFMGRLNGAWLITFFFATFFYFPVHMLGLNSRFNDLRIPIISVIDNSIKNEIEFSSVLIVKAKNCLQMLLKVWTQKQEYLGSKTRGWLTGQKGYSIWTLRWWTLDCGQGMDLPYFFDGSLRTSWSKHGFDFIIGFVVNANPHSWFVLNVFYWFDCFIQFLSLPLAFRVCRIVYNLLSLVIPWTWFPRFKSNWRLFFWPNCKHKEKKTARIWLWGICSRAFA